MHSCVLASACSGRTEKKTQPATPSCFPQSKAVQVVRFCAGMHSADEVSLASDY